MIAGGWVESSIRRFVTSSFRSPLRREKRFAPRCGLAGELLLSIATTVTKSALYKQAACFGALVLVSVAPESNSGFRKVRLRGSATSTGCVDAGSLPSASPGRAAEGPPTAGKGGFF
jgi:hypothetical protein